MVDFLRSCYRGWFRLNTDPAVLTPGRFYFASWDTPACPVGTLRSSRNYVADRGRAELEWGEVDGPQKWDNGAPPIFDPLPKLLGTEDCLLGGKNDAVAADPASDFFRVVCIGGRDYRFPTIIYASFSVARHDSEFTYYNDVPLTVVDAVCEARYEGPSGIPNVTAIMRVTDVPDGSLATNFYLADAGTPPPPPIVTTCCVIPTPARLYAEVVIGGVTLDFTIDHDGAAWTGELRVSTYFLYRLTLVCNTTFWSWTLQGYEDPDWNWHNEPDGGPPNFWENVPRVTPITYQNGWDEDVDDVVCSPFELNSAAPFGAVFYTWNSPTYTAPPSGDLGGVDASGNVMVTSVVITE